MAELLKCVFCNSSDTNLILFTKETLKKCRVILKHRKEHNLKFKDVILPVDLYDNGYHRNCYKSFTGLMKKYYLPKSDVQSTQLKSSNLKPSPTFTSIPNTNTIPEVVESVPSTSQKNNIQLEIGDPLSEIDISIKSDINTDSRNITCIFCDQKTKKHRSKRLPLIRTIKKDFLSRIDRDNEINTELINKIVNYPGLTLYYHINCQSNFSYKAKSSQKTTRSYWHDIRDHHQSAFEEITGFIEENIIKNGQYYFLTYLHSYYMELLEENEENSSENHGCFTSQNLECKIRKIFNKEIKFFTVQNKKILAPKNVTNIDEQSFEQLKDQSIIHKAALLLRKSILRIEKKKLPQQVSAQSLQEGEASVPQELLDFLSTVIAGSNPKRKNDPEFIRQVQSCSKDIVYTVHNEIDDN
ncbi:hypothetical protein PV327_003054 [Microctonus hyperodae]|uniref:Uncharacterized protein n=1 Tax=Microctonus hyperodae TaxID=165561 RepID=A0AA39G3N2_MICHY|nr:hypothetical protein PV327_003054 [Microctonus hyperodae]